MMTPEEPKVAPTGRYSVTETCRALGVHRNTLQRYTDAGKIRCGYRRANMRKFYTGMEILKLWRSVM